ncbi:MAG: hypothetical protein HC845_00870 [Akkermansiaceae bacterium]|nr:hypothetical protein [Akkermansiaceae bacterium]
MSIKGFHIVFVTVSTLLFLFLALWSFFLAPESTVMIKALGIAGTIGLIVMPIYGVCFYRKITKAHI